MKKILCTFLVALPLCSFAEDSSRAFTSIFYANDSDNFDVVSVNVGYNPQYTNDTNKTEIVYKNTTYSEPDWHYNENRIFYRKEARDSNYDGYHYEIGISDRGHAFLDAAYRTTPGPWSWEAFVNRDLVESHRAIDDDIAFNLLGVSLEYPIHPKLTAVGVLTGQWFEDGNQRIGERLRFIYQPDLDVGFTAQLRLRHYDSSTDPVVYYNPHRYDEYLLAMTYKTLINDWRVNAMLATGTSRTDGVEQPVTLAEIGIKSPEQKGWQHALSLNYQKNAANENGSYRYSSIMYTLSKRF